MNWWEIREMYLVQHGVNKPPILNQRNAYGVLILLASPRASFWIPPYGTRHQAKLRASVFTESK